MALTKKGKGSGEILQDPTVVEIVFIGREVPGYFETVEKGSEYSYSGKCCTEGRRRRPLRRKEKGSVKRCGKSALALSGSNCSSRVHWTGVA